MTTRPGTPEYYSDKAGEVRWRVRDTNGEVTEASSEGFANLRKAFDNYTITRSNVQIDYEEARKQLHAGTNQNAGQSIADSSGSAGEGEEEDPDGGEEGAGGSSEGLGGEDGSPEGSGSGEAES